MLISVNGIDLFYECVGHGQPLILLHGNDEDHHIFDHLAIKLKDLFTVYLIDSRGHGQSTKDCLLSYQLMAADITAFIKQLNIIDPIIYGFSDGGIVSLLMAIEDQINLKKIIISGVNIHPFGIAFFTYIKYLIEYLKHGSKTIKMMLSQPHIKKPELDNIRIPVIMTAGENDVIRQKHTLYIHKNIKGSVSQIIYDQDHQSYVIDNDQLMKIIMPYLADDPIIGFSR